MKIIDKMIERILTKSGAIDALNNQAKHINAVRVKLKQLEDNFSNMDKMIVLLQHNNKSLENRLMAHIDLVNALDESNAALTERVEELSNKETVPFVFAGELAGKQSINIPHDVTRAKGLIEAHHKSEDASKTLKELKSQMESAMRSKGTKDYSSSFSQKLNTIVFYTHPPVNGRLMNLFAKHELIFVGDLCAVEKTDLRSRFPGINQNFIRVIKANLLQQGLYFGMPEAKFWKHQTMKI